ncbi:MAG TPA: hypothetical protein VGR32_12415 [Brevundimonas sp.]|jgi:hypothetical protein|uniref:hypothetical protein n=1 Tax=Brevundimonas sp. TaxID=1871086 RepID=UPI002DE36F89|nr:hypothetical protein [Brevundimonas sp.]
MSLAALALTAALLAPQDPVSHQQAVTCTGVFIGVAVMAGAAQEESPSAENEELLATAGKLAQAADADRVAAAGREGIALEASGQAVNAWLEAAVADGSLDAIQRELEPCLTRYASAL